MSLVRVGYNLTVVKLGINLPVLWANRGLCLVSSLQGRNQIHNQNPHIKCFSSEKKDDDNLDLNRSLTSTTKPTNLTQAQKLKKAVTEYGSTVIVFHVTISLVSLGTCYALVSSGLDLEQLLANLNLSNWFKKNPELISNAGTFAVAYAVHKVFAPVRIAITLGSVPFIVKYLRHRGILKK